MTRFLSTALILGVLAAASSAQSVSLTVTPNPAPSGQALRVTLANGTAQTLFMPNSGPWTIHDANGRFVFSPIVLPAVFTLAPGKSLWWTWDQKDRVPQQVAPGSYEVRLNYAFTTGPGQIARVWFTIGSTSTLSVSGTPSPGRTISFLLRSPNFVSRSYQAALSLGKSPGIPLGAGRRLPLNPDPLFFASLAVGPPVFVDFAGQLDSSGRGTAKLAIPNVAALRGTRFFAAFVVFHLAAPNGIAEASAASAVVVQ